MSVKIENELKFTVLRLPKDFERLGIDRIINYYTSLPPNPLRDRSMIGVNGEHYFITKKMPVGSNDHSRKLEGEIEIEQKDFKEQIKLAKTKPVFKDRHYKPVKSGLVGEIDVFLKEFRGLLWVEFEFKTEKQRRHFVKPDWVGRNITNEPFASNAYLAFKAKDTADIACLMQPDDLLWFRTSHGMRPIRAADFLKR